MWCSLYCSPYNSFLVHRCSSFGAGITPVWMTSVQCNGTEDSLKNCDFPGFGVVPIRIRIDLFAAGVVCYSECIRVYVCVCVCACVCACMRVCMHAYVRACLCMCICV